MEIARIEGHTDMEETEAKPGVPGLRPNGHRSNSGDHKARWRRQLIGGREKYATAEQAGGTGKLTETWGSRWRGRGCKASSETTVMARRLSSAGEETAAKFAELGPSPAAGVLEEGYQGTAELHVCLNRPGELRSAGNGGSHRRLGFEFLRC